ncbi:MAG: hypothetical protein HGA65_01130 [Oscillochloris sp.]|nr:hypothetical protein [Oscillochloris sp.]
MSNQEPTIAHILRMLAREYDGLVEERQLLDKVLERRPSTAKNPYATIRERLRWDGMALGWLRLSRSQLVPLRVVLGGLRFRCLPRAQDIATGTLPFAHIQPFANLQHVDLRMCDMEGERLMVAYPDRSQADEAPIVLPGFDLRTWYARHGFAVGDSILVTVTDPDRATFQIEYESAAAARLALVAAQDAELIEAIVARVNRSQRSLIPCEEIILPIFALAPWRAAYPGSPWQHLVTRDGRIQLVDDTFLTNQHYLSLRLFTSDGVFESAPQPEVERIAADTALLAEIEVLQRDLRQAREDDADAGLWNGQIQRASAAYSAFDYYGDDPHVRGTGFNALDYDDSDDDQDDLLGLGGLDPEDALFEGEEFARLQAAHQELMSALPPGVPEQIEAARPEEAEVIISQYLNMLLAKKPHLFPPLDLSVNSDEESLEPAAESLFDAEAWQESIEDEADWDEDDEDGLPTDDDTARVYAESSDLASQFYDYLSELGKSNSTARARSRNVLVYAEFLASYYNRSLASGDYATLDECLFYYYPRRVMNTSPRQVREICTSIKQFYGFMKERGVIVDDRFAHALWRRRDQAARVVQIYDRIASDSPNFESLFMRLFQPYTE